MQFGFLTVRENLRLFAKIKGIQPHEVEQQVDAYASCHSHENETAYLENTKCVCVISTRFIVKISKRPFAMNSKVIVSLRETV